MGLEVQGQPAVWFETSPGPRSIGHLPSILLCFTPLSQKEPLCGGTPWEYPGPQAGAVLQSPIPFLDLKADHNVQAMGAHTFNPVFPVQGRPCLHSESEASQGHTLGPCLKITTTKITTATKRP